MRCECSKEGCVVMDLKPNNPKLALANDKTPLLNPTQKSHQMFCLLYLGMMSPKKIRVFVMILQFTCLTVIQFVRLEGPCIWMIILGLAKEPSGWNLEQYQY